MISASFGDEVVELLGFGSRERFVEAAVCRLFDVRRPYWDVVREVLIFGTEVEHSAIGVVKGSIFRSETYV